MADTAGLGELWVRASRLCERCDMHVCTVAFPAGWEVAFRRKQDLTMVATARAEHLLEAVLQAVNRAELAGL